MPRIKPEATEYKARTLSSVLCGPQAYFIFYGFQDWRALMGPTKVFKTRYSDPETIRGQFGLTDTRNSSRIRLRSDGPKRDGLLFPGLRPGPLLPRNFSETFDEELRRWIRWRQVCSQVLIRLEIFIRSKATDATVVIVSCCILVLIGNKILCLHICL